MLTKSKYDKLALLGIDIWQVKPKSVRCLVVQYCAQNTPEINPAENKILQGMVSVLELEEYDLMHVKISSLNPDLSRLHASIDQWRPKYILQLSMELPVLNRPNCVQTYSPGFLLQNPQYKPAAYKSLLHLRAMLHGTSISNS